MDEAARFGDLLQTFRAAHGRAPLRAAQPLTRAAQIHAEDLARRIVLTHGSENGDLAAERAAAQGYAWALVLENVAFGQQNADQVLTSWANSPDHRTAMLNPEVTEYGVGLAWNHIGPYWALTLARPA
ncbi:MAG: CAP domain-containing protein [Rhodobacteraceae bacterium]|nr:CAP domain-containing protein [Paracoccaceae bacterium]